MRRTVWNTGGCSSWYLDSHGRNTVLWPKSTFTFRRLLARFDPEAYDVQAAGSDAHGGGDRMKTLDDHVVVVTGAASGIGRAVAVAVARRGSLVAISDVDEEGLAETVELVKAAGARAVRSDRLDVSDRAAMAAYATAVAEQFGRVNVVVNNAGVALTGDVEDLAYDDMEWIIGINFWGVVNGTKEFLPHLVASGEGHVVNLSSLFGLISVPGQSMYNAAKYAVRGFTEALREEMLVPATRSGSRACIPAGSRPRSPATPATPTARTGWSRPPSSTSSWRDVAGARGRDHRDQGHPGRPRPAPGRARRPRPPPRRAPHRLPLPGRRRRGRQASSAPQALTGPDRPLGGWQDRGMACAPGDPVRLEMTKWGDRPHWEFDALWLGSDEHGDWVGIPAGTPMSRPGAHVRIQVDQVGLIPPPDAPAAARGWLATFHAPGGPRVSVYVDITTPPLWDGPVLRAVDLDLDVVRGVDGRVWLDDEDEFAEHRVELGYPRRPGRGRRRPRATGSRHSCVVPVRPYDGAHEPWLRVLTALT